ncbi:MAG TPA: carboxypeptidase regulatory-like domain-containing protein, partial [Gemmatimonadaceae bacterium]
PDTTAALTLSVGQEREQSLSIANVAAHLDTIRVVERSQCRVGDVADATAAVWDQARTALLAAQMTARLRSVNATIITYERTLDPNSERIREQSSGIMSGLTVRPWTSLTPDSVRKVGYILTAKDGSLSYLAPDLDGLLSPNFVADHCFKITKSRDTTVLGIAFEPGRDRAKIPEIQGTLWLDRRSADLKRLEFTYANVPSEQRERAGGDMAFVRMSNGGYAISHWAIKMPVLERGVVNDGRFDTRVVELRSVGGELSYAVSGKDTLFASAPLVLSGVVQDSTTGKAVAGARLTLTGTSLAGETDAKGKFAIPGVLPGQYTVEVHTADYDAIKAAIQWPVLFSDPRASLTMKIPSVAEVAKARSATFSGTVVADSTGQPIIGADISLPQLGMLAIANERGAFRMQDIPTGTYDVTVRRVGYGPLTTSLTFPARQVTDRRIVLTRLQVLDTVVVEGESPMADFEANRKLGLGHFLTRAQLDKMQGRPMAATLSEIKGLGMVFGHSSHSYIESTHGSASLSVQQGFNLFKNEKDAYVKMRAAGYIPPHIWCPDGTAMDASLGLKCGCYAQVYLDRTLLNPGEPTEPFDVNSISPDMIEAVEYYSNPAQTPMRYQARNGTCGVLVLHRRRNYDKPGADSTKAKP